jgi:transcriptional regulator with GAF, ATPase, and Fis domain/CHASE2 domain-containing sensor protein
MLSRRSWLDVSGIALLCVVAVVTFVANNALFLEFENRVLDKFFKFRPGLATSPDIVLVDIDDQSIGKIGRWPWDRTYHAKMIRVLSQSGAAAIGYDILFNQSATEAENRALSEAMRQGGNVVLPTGFELGSNKNDRTIPFGTREIGPLPEIRLAAAGIGHISANRDPDGIIRQVPLMVQTHDQLVPAFSLALLSRYYGVNLEDLRLYPSHHVVIPGSRGNGVGNRHDKWIGVDKEGMMTVNFAGRWSETFRHYSFTDILDAWETQDGRQQLSHLVSGNICIVSNTATGYDLKSIPLERDFPGGGIHANAINTIMTGQYLHRVSSWAMLGIIVPFTMVAGVVAAVATWWIGLVAMVIAVVSYVVLAYFAFINGSILPTIAPIVAACLSYSFVTVYQNRHMQFHVARLTKEKREMGVAFLATSDAIKEKEDLLDLRQQELSNLRYDIDEFQGQQKEKLDRIEILENALKETVLAKEALVRQLGDIEDKMRDMLVESIPTLKADVEVDRLQKDFGIVTRDRTTLERLARVMRTLSVNNPILIQGETGTGKELFAWAFHKMGPRAEKAFITVNIPGIPENLLESELFGHVKGSFTGALSDKKGKFQLADHGTIFLDEIGEMKLELQAKLLRVLESGAVDRIGATSPDRVDVGIIAATNRDLQAEVASGRFREDLYFRLNAITFMLPPLRERTDDIDVLARYFLGKCTLESGRHIVGFTVKALERLKSYPWRGNIRELRNVIRRGVALAEGDRIIESDLELGEPTPSNLAMPRSVTDGFIEKVETWGPLSDRDMIVNLRKNGFDIGKTADLLGVARNTVGSRLKGVCFMALAESGLDFKRAAKVVAGDNGPAEVVERRIQEYYGNLIRVAQRYGKSAEAIAECRRRSKNLPKKYYEGMDRVVTDYFGERTGNA